MPSSSRTSLSALQPDHPVAPLEINQENQADKNTSSSATTAEAAQEDVLEVEGLIDEKVNNATEPAQAIINSLAVDPDLEKATTTKRKRRTKKATKTTTSAKTKTATRSQKTTAKSTKSAKKA